MQKIPDHTPLDTLPKDKLPNARLYFGFPITRAQLVSAAKALGLITDSESKIRYPSFSPVRRKLQEMYGILDVAMVADPHGDGDYVVAFERTDRYPNQRRKVYTAAVRLKIQALFGIESSEPLMLRWYFDSVAGESWRMMHYARTCRS